jgi:hypothetical protein
VDQQLRITEKQLHSPSPRRSGEKVPKADEGHIPKLMPAMVRSSGDVSN